jgi:hypothetical protein
MPHLSGSSRSFRKEWYSGAVVAMIGDSGSMISGGSGEMVYAVAAVATR